MDQSITIGLDLAKAVFQVHRIDSHGCLSPSVAAGAGVGVLFTGAALPRRHGGLLRRILWSAR